MKHSQGFLKLVDEAKTRVREITRSEVLEHIQKKRDFLLIDVREESEWARGHLPNAVHLSKGVIERDIESKVPNLNQEIVLYCGGGFRSALSADSLQKMGYKNIRSMEGGFGEWVKEGRPLAS